MKRRLPARYSKARQAADAVVSLIPYTPSTAPTEPGEIIRSALKQALLRAYKAGDLASLHPLLLEACDRKRRELEIKEEALNLFRRKVEALEEKTPTGSGELTREDIDKIKEIYGIYPSDPIPPDPDPQTG